MIVEHNQSTYNGGQYNNVYKFNGKELDDATGMYYYGARYYDPRISIFISVDPLAEDFAGWTPYHYVHQNPINLIDPTGMSAENSDGGGWLSKAWNSTKNEVKSWFGGSKPNYEVIMEEPQLTAWDYGESVPCIECHHDTTATNGEKIGDLVGGSGGIIHSGIGYNKSDAWEDIPGKPKIVKATDMSTYSFGQTKLIQHLIEALSKGVSIGEDQNIQNIFKGKNDDPYINHSYKDFGIYVLPYTDKKIISGHPKRTMMRRSEIEQFDKDRQFDSIKLIPLLN